MHVVFVFIIWKPSLLASNLALVYLTFITTFNRNELYFTNYTNLTNPPSDSGLDQNESFGNVIKQLEKYSNYAKFGLKI